MKNIFFLLFCFIFASSRAQFEYICSYGGEFREINQANEANETVVETTNSILEALNIEQEIILKSADVDFAAYKPIGERNFIFYNPYFFASLDYNNETDWVTISVLAHELGHLIHNHTTSTHENELIADGFSGKALCALGANKEDAIRAIEILSLRATESHPPKSSRIERIRNGWSISCGPNNQWFVDNDQDGFGDPNISIYSIDSIKGYVRNNYDPYDQNDQAYPGQQAFFYVDRGDGSFDYNGDGIEEKEFTTLGQCGDGEANPAGWVPVIPECGKEGKWLDDCDRKIKDFKIKVVREYSTKKQGGR